MTTDTESPNPPETPEETFFVIEGRITDFQMRLGRVNLLKKLNVGSTKQNLAAGLAGAVGDNPALAANAALLESYDGENAAYFGCHLGEHLVIGQFSGAHLLKNRDHVKAVVSTQGNVLYAHAIVRPKDGLLWVPVGEDRGRWAVLRSQMRMAGWSFLGVMVIAIVTAVISSKGSIEGVMWIAIAGASLVVPMALWVYHDLKPLALEAEKIFKALDFPDPTNLDLRPGSYDIHHQNYDENEQSVYYYQAVLDAYRTGTKVKIDVPSIGEQRRRENQEAQPEVDRLMRKMREEDNAKKKRERDSKRKPRSS